MKQSDLHSCAAKLEQAHKAFRTTFASVDQRWTDAARRDFEENYLKAMEPKVRNMVEEIARLAEVISAAEHQCES